MGVDDITLKIICTMSDGLDGQAKAHKGNTKRDLWNSLESKILVKDGIVGRSMLLQSKQVELLCPVMQQQLDLLYKAIDANSEPYTVPSDKHPANLFYSQISEIGFCSLFLMEMTMMLETEEEDKLNEQPIKATFAPFDIVGQVCVHYSPAAG